VHVGGVEVGEAAEALERYLGDPMLATNQVSFSRSVHLDEIEAFPRAMLRRLQTVGTQSHLVPRELGGNFEAFDELMALNRVISRRDLTLAIAYGQTYLGAAPIWVGGSDTLKRQLADIILNGGAGALALTEEEHGSDVLASEFFAQRVDGGFLLSGRKWLINNGTEGKTLTIFARTATNGGPRGFSLFLFDRERAAPSCVRPVPKVLTLGIRGADISGIELERCFVPDAALVGDVGLGLEITLKALQITRTLCAGFSLGAADSAIRLAARFAAERRLYQGFALDIPDVRAQLSEAFLDLLAADIVSRAGARALHVSTEQMSVWSAVVKYFVPTLSEEITRTSAGILGARHYLRGGHASGVFQKLLRDNSLIGLFDGSAAVNLQAIAQNLRTLLSAGLAGEQATLPDRLARIFNPKCPLEAFVPNRLEVFCRGADDAVGGLPATLERISKVHAHDSIVPSLAAELLLARDEIATEVTELHAKVGTAAIRTAEMMQLARRYCALHCAASCLHTLVWSALAPEAIATMPAIVDRLLGRARIARRSRVGVDRDAIIGWLQRLIDQHLAMSVVPFPLAKSGAVEENP